MKSNIFTTENKKYENEIFETILQNDCILLERIISDGQTTPDGKWYDDDRDEWVLLLKGKAEIEFEDGEKVGLLPGDYLLIKANRRHKVTYTDLQNKTIWLTLYYKSLIK